MITVKARTDHGTTLMSYWQDMCCYTSAMQLKSNVIARALIVKIVKNKWMYFSKLLI